jgi:hypothetical protein
VELESRQPTINSPPHIASHLMGIPKRVPFWLVERTKTVRGYEAITSRFDTYNLSVSLKDRQGCVRPRSGKRRVCISYNAMMSIYPGVSEIYTAYP